MFFIRLFGVPVYLTGNVIDLGNLQIASGRGLQWTAVPLPAVELGFSGGLSFPGATLAARAGVSIDNSDHYRDE